MKTKYSDIPFANWEFYAVIVTAVGGLGSLFGDWSFGPVLGWLGFAIMILLPLIGWVLVSPPDHEDYLSASSSFLLTGILLAIFGGLCLFAKEIFEGNTVVILGWVSLSLASVYLILQSVFNSKGNQLAVIAKEKARKRRASEQEDFDRRAKKCPKCGCSRGEIIGKNEEFRGNIARTLKPGMLGYNMAPNGIQSGRIFMKQDIYECPKCGNQWVVNLGEETRWDSPF